MVLLKQLSRVLLPYTITDIKTSAYTAVIGELVLLDASGGAFTVTLPDPSGSSGLGITFKSVSDTTNEVTIDGDGATIDGEANTVINVAYDTITVVSDDSNWLRFPAV